MSVATPTGTTTVRLTTLPNPISFVEHKHCRFLIFDAPTDANVDLYLKEFKKYNVKCVVRACDPTYSNESLVKNGIELHELPFPDGGAPGDDIVRQWLNVCNQIFDKGSNNNNDAIGVHCVAGLGRAPVLVAVALIESGLKYDDAVELIRQKRKGAINAKQLKFLKTYVPQKKCIII